MSKTDKTRPWWIKTEHLIEVHQHENGLCDIAGTQPTRSNVGWKRDRCYYDATWWHHTFWCGCGLCGIPRDVKRRARRAGRREERNWWREV